MPEYARFVSILSLLVLVFSACNMPSDAKETESPNAILTAAAQTVEANLTQAAVANPTAAPVQPAQPTNTIAPPDITLSAPTNTLPVATNTETCDQAQFVKDITVPDGTQFQPNENFTKIWRLKNIGSCSWNGYSLVFDTGDSMDGPASIPIGTVAPGQEVDLSVDLKAPDANGTYRGYWRIKNNAGVLIPVQSGYQSKSFYVEIKVGDSSGGKFAVTGITFTVTTFDEGANKDCPKVTANITANGAGTVNYDWTWSDGTDTPPKSITFASAGTKSVEQKWYLGSGTSGSNFWIGIYVDDPNHQDFGHVAVSKCTAP